jgi:hypothetical protein
MDRTTRSFILASLIYLAAGATLGLLMGVVPQFPGRLLFSHVHLLLGGFMAMMIYGVGYFILPRFAATAIRWPSLVALHFWLANLSLLAMVVSRPLSFAYDSSAWKGVFHVSALVQLVSILVFVLNLGLTLVSRPQAKPNSPGLQMASPRRASAAAAIGPDAAVGLIVDRKQGALEILIEAGLTPLRDPQHLEMVRRAGISLSHACERHGIDMAQLLPRLAALEDRSGPRGGVGLTPDQLIGEMVDAHPGTRAVLRRRFGEGCFTCPGFATETLAQGALMHGVRVEALIAELQQVVDTEIS